jgi:hypothetical protein
LKLALSANRETIRILLLETPLGLAAAKKLQFRKTELRRVTCGLVADSLGASSRCPAAYCWAEGTTEVGVAQPHVCEFGTRQAYFRHQLTIRHERKPCECLCAMFVLLAAASTGLCQNSESDPCSQQLVRTLMKDGPVISMVEKNIKPTGRSRRGSALIREISSEKSLNPKEIKRICFIVRMAFTAPQIISSDADRGPPHACHLRNMVSCPLQQERNQRRLPAAMTFWNVDHIIPSAGLTHGNLHCRPQVLIMNTAISPGHFQHHVLERAE